MITGPLCKAARSLVEISRARLSEAAKVDKAVIELFERGIQQPDAATAGTLQAALEELGAVFLPEERALGAGVRLKFNRSVTRRIANLENEGGPAANDEVP